MIEFKGDRRVFLGLALAALLPAAPAGAATVDAYISGAAGDFMKLARSGAGKAAMRTKFTGLLGRYVDARGISLLSLGSYQKQLTPDLRDQFLKLSIAYISAFFVYYADEFKGNEIRVKSTGKQGKFTTVDSEIVFSDGDTKKVKWRLVPAGGGFRVQDVNVRGVWLSLALKDRYTDILKRSKGSFDPLFAELKSAETW